MPSLAHLSLHSPLGDLTLFAEEDGLVALEWGWAGSASVGTPLLDQASAQIGEYFDGGRQSFSLPLHLAGTPFQRRVWDALRQIPYGETASYGDLAHTLDSAPRAVASACARNPLPIIIPCHRVIASDGRLGGYSSGEGVPTKAALLRLEGGSPDR